MNMNTIDLLVCLVGLWAVWSGWRKGCIVQVCSLAGLGAAIWLAFRFGSDMGRTLGLDSSVADIGGFVVVLLLGFILFAIVGRLLRGIFNFAGLSLLDIVLGIALSVLKFALILSLLFSAFDSLNKDWKLVDEATLESSRTYKPLIGLSERIFPFVEELGKSIPVTEEKI